MKLVPHVPTEKTLLSLFIPVHNSQTLNVTSQWTIEEWIITIVVVTCNGPSD